MNDHDTAIETARIILKLAEAGLLVRIDGQWVPTEAGWAMLERIEATVN